MVILKQTYHTCIACITVDSILRMNKCKIKKTDTPRFTNTELQTDSESDSETK